MGAGYKHCRTAYRAAACTQEFWKKKDWQPDKIIIPHSFIYIYIYLFIYLNIYIYVYIHIYIAISLQAGDGSHIHIAACSGADGACPQEPLQACWDGLHNPTCIYLFLYIYTCIRTSWHDTVWHVTRFDMWHGLTRDTVWHVTRFDTWHGLTRDMLWHATRFASWHDTWHALTGVMRWHVTCRDMLGHALILIFRCFDAWHPVTCTKILTNDTLSYVLTSIYWKHKQNYCACQIVSKRVKGHIDHPLGVSFRVILKITFASKILQFPSFCASFWGAQQPSLADFMGKKTSCQQGYVCIQIYIYIYIFRNTYMSMAASVDWV